MSEELNVPSEEVVEPTPEVPAEEVVPEDSGETPPVE